MRLVVAPDKFAGTLTAPQAARAIMAGWRRRAPTDELVSCPMSDGGPGFVDVLHAALGGDLLALTVRGPRGEATPATLLLHAGTAYVEAAQACGLHLVDPAGHDPEVASTSGVGDLVAAAVDTGATHLVVGVGGTATNDGGAGLLGALGAKADSALDDGVRGLSGVSAVDLEIPCRRVSGISLVVATDVDVPLLGMFGATKMFGPQKGLPAERVPAVDAVLERFVLASLGGGFTQRKLADSAGAGAGGGIGFGLLALGAERRSGVDLVAAAVGLAARASAADLVVTGEGCFDFSSRSGKVVAGVAAAATGALRPCIVLAGQVLVGTREMRALGVDSAYAAADVVGPERSLAEPAESLSVLADRVARTWSR